MRALRDRKKLQSDYIGFFRKKPFLLAVTVIFCAILYLGLPGLLKTTYRSELSAAAPLPAAVAVMPPEVVHLPTPKPQKTIYMTGCVAGLPSFRDELVKLAEETELNGIVIDIKDYTGMLSFVPRSTELNDFVSTKCAVSDMKEFIEALHKKGIYVIGRITVFQDPLLAKRRPDLAVKKASDGVWKHIVSIGKESYAIGFDELNFDYIRFPSDGPMTDISFPWSKDRDKSEVLEGFFKYLSEELKPKGAVLSADVFGMTTTNTDDLNIGQVLEKIAPYFDYVAPMVYPSHYPPRFNNWPDPNARPYDIVKFSMDSAVKRFLATSTVVALSNVTPLASTTPPLYPKKPWQIQKLRPWLQDFDYGGNYDIAEVRAQITAVYDAGLTSWMLWAPTNRYTKGALLPE